MDIEKEYEVEKILDHAVVNEHCGATDVVKYLVRWVGYDSSEDTWQTADDLMNAVDILLNYRLGVFMKDYCLSMLFTFGCAINDLGMTRKNIRASVKALLFSKTQAVDALDRLPYVVSILESFDAHEVEQYTDEKQISVSISPELYHYYLLYHIVKRVIRKPELNNDETLMREHMHKMFQFATPKLKQEYETELTKVHICMNMIEFNITRDNIRFQS